MGVLRRLRRRRVLRKAPSEAWHLGLSAVRHLRGLDDERRARVEEDARIFAAETHWEGCGGLTVSDGMKAVVASLAALLVVDNRETLFEHVSSVLLYPSGFASPAATGPNGIVSIGSARLGEAHFNGPIVLSWSDSLRHATQATGRNVVLHEFAHKLDMLDGLVDGTPPLRQGIPLERWVDTMTHEYEALRQGLAIGMPGPVDPYAATNPGEFFAVATEAYFERPVALRHDAPALHALLQDYYGVDTDLSRSA